MLPAELLERQAKREVKEAVSPVLPARSAAGVNGERQAAKSTVSTLWSPSDMTRKEEQAYNAAVLGRLGWAVGCGVSLVPSQHLVARRDPEP